VYSHFHPKPHVCVDDWFIVELPKNKALFVVGVLHEKPHPFTLALGLVFDLDLHRVAPFVPAHRFSFVASKPEVVYRVIAVRYP
jgi:hypothetical protein